MDSRYEPFPQEILNQLISIINTLIQENTDDLLMNEVLRDRVKKIGEYIYLYTEHDVDVSGILSKHNLLSIDVVLFPLIYEIANHVTLVDNFDELISRIKSLISQENSSKSLNDVDALFIQKIKHVLEQCDHASKRLHLF
jgi:hypothetical protein